MCNLAIRKCTSPPLLAPRLKIFKWKFTTPPGIEPRTCWTRGRHATIWASAANVEETKIMASAKGIFLCHCTGYSGRCVVSRNIRWNISGNIFFFEGNVLGWCIILYRFCFACCYSSSYGFIFINCHFLFEFQLLCLSLHGLLKFCHLKVVSGAWTLENGVPNRKIWTFPIYSFLWVQ